MPAAAGKIVMQGILTKNLAIGLSVLILLMVLPALFDPKKFRAAVDEFLNAGNAAMRLNALYLLLIAFLILNTRWKLNFKSWNAVLGVIGYLILLKGIIRFWFPELSRNIIRKWMHKDYGVYLMAFIGLIIALGLGYLGIWVY
ncbi:hypothetical protein HZC21_06150 [Candidatus Peregrinibacteria bacterium]|nr:hypothetical protein [Candidatus Peregrinibacteria bacterium]